MSVESSEMISVPRAEWDSLQAEVRRLRREVGQRVAIVRIQADLGPGDQLAEAWGITG
jgi:hypothetical protein